jgi:hypothetical protein
MRSMRAMREMGDILADSPRNTREINRQLKCLKKAKDMLMRDVCKCCSSEECRFPRLTKVSAPTPPRQGVPLLAPTCAGEEYIQACEGLHLGPLL